MAPSQTTNTLPSNSCLKCLADNELPCPHGMCSNCPCLLCGTALQSNTGQLRARCGSCDKADVVTVRTCLHCMMVICATCAQLHRDAVVQQLCQESEKLASARQGESTFLHNSNKRSNELRALKAVIEQNRADAVARLEALYAPSLHWCDTELTLIDTAAKSHTKRQSMCDRFLTYVRSAVERARSTTYSPYSKDAVDQTLTVLAKYHASNTNACRVQLPLPLVKDTDVSFGKIKLLDLDSTTYYQSTVNSPTAGMPRPPSFSQLSTQLSQYSVEKSSMMDQVATVRLQKPVESPKNRRSKTPTRVGALNNTIRSLLSRKN